MLCIVKGEIIYVDTGLPALTISFCYVTKKDRGTPKNTIAVHGVP